MKKGKILSSIVLVCMAACWTIVPPGCANIIPPAGGPRDSIPPQVLKADPPDSTVNFTGDHITLTFDEYVDLKDLSNNVLFTPTFETVPKITVKAKTIRINFENPLDRNTTYVMNFGNAIVDMNEGNVLKNYTYTFSTGARLDSLEISGRVLLAQTGGVDSTLIAVLHRNLRDSAVMNERPQYVVRLDRNGAFHFRNLPADTFALYIIGDAAVSKRYSTKSQLFAFADRPVIAGQPDSLILYAYREEEKRTAAPTTESQRIPASDRRLRFTPLTNGTQDLLTDYILQFPVPLRSFDSNKVHLSTDSSFSPVRYQAGTDSLRKELRFHTDWKENTLYNLVLEKDFAADTTGRQLLKTDTLFFTTKKAADYGRVSIKLSNVDLTRHPVLQFVQNNQVVFSVAVPSGSFSQNLFLPGEYGLRILYDTNGNGVWDPGHFFKGRRQPEVVKLIQRTITVKPDWENEFEAGL